MKAKDLGVNWTGGGGVYGWDFGPLFFYCIYGGL